MERACSAIARLLTSGACRRRRPRLAEGSPFTTPLNSFRNGALNIAGGVCRGCRRGWRTKADAEPALRMKGQVCGEQRGRSKGSKRVARGGGHGLINGGTLPVEGCEKRVRRARNGRGGRGKRMRRRREGRGRAGGKREGRGVQGCVQLQSAMQRQGTHFASNNIRRRQTY